MLPTAVTDWLLQEGYGQVKASRSVGGGCINNGRGLETASGQSFFLKTNTNSPADMFVREAEGLAALEAADAVRVPQVLLVGERFLLLEHLQPAAPAADYWPRFGRQLGELHQHTNSQFGFGHDNYIGSTPQVNEWNADGYVFFGQQRLLFQARLARENGYFDGPAVRRVESLVHRLPELVPPQPASLLHGDLWSGNAIRDEQGGPAIIDPAAHYGWAEAELAMTVLFGAFPAEFYESYREQNPLEPGWRDRFPIYNLYHLLNHLNLFGMSYHAQVMSILERYS